MRGEICEGLSGLGIELDPERNVAHNAGREGLISVDTSRVAVYVIPTNEELLIARDTVRGRERRPTAFLELGVSVWAFQIPGATQFVQGDVMRFRTHPLLPPPPRAMSFHRCHAKSSTKSSDGSTKMASD